MKLSSCIDKVHMEAHKQSPTVCFHKIYNMPSVNEASFYLLSKTL